MAGARPHSAPGAETVAALSRRCPDIPGGARIHAHPPLLQVIKALHGAGLKYRERLIAVVEGLGKGHLTRRWGVANGRRRHIDARTAPRRRAAKGNIAKLAPGPGLREGPGEIDLEAYVLSIPRLELPGHIADVRPHHQGFRAEAQAGIKTQRETEPSPAP